MALDPALDCWSRIYAHTPSPAPIESSFASRGIGPELSSQVDHRQVNRSTGLFYSTVMMLLQSSTSNTAANYGSILDLFFLKSPRG